MSVLDSVLRYKAEREAQSQQLENAIPNAINTFIQAKQQAQQLQNQNLITQLTAAKQGFRIENGQLVQDKSLMNQDDLLNNTLKMERIKSLQRKEEDPYGVNRAIAQKNAVEKNMGVTSADAGREALAKEGIKNILKMRKELYPDGTPKSFQRSEAFKSRAAKGKAFPNSTEGQRLYRLGSTAISGRQLISTGVAARPDETKALTDAFIADAFSNPEAHFEGLQQLEDFYKDYIKTSAPNRYDDIISEVYGDSGSNNSNPITSDMANTAQQILAKRRAKK